MITGVKSVDNGMENDRLRSNPGSTITLTHNAYNRRLYLTLYQCVRVSRTLVAMLTSDVKPRIPLLRQTVLCEVQVEAGGTFEPVVPSDTFEQRNMS